MLKLVYVAFNRCGQILLPSLRMGQSMLLRLMSIDVIETYVFWNGHEPEKRQVINILNLYKVFHVCNVFSDGTVNC